MQINAQRPSAGAQPMAALHACGHHGPCAASPQGSGGLRTGKAPEVVDAHFVVQLEHAAQALHPPPVSILLVRLQSPSLLIVPTSSNLSDAMRPHLHPTA